MNVHRPMSLPDVEEIDRPAAPRTLATLIEASPLAIVTFDPEGVVTMWSPAAERIFGWSENEALGTRLPFVPAEKQEEFLALRRRALLGEVFTEPELHRRRADGSPIVVSVSTSPLRRPDGTIYGIMSILMDVTEHKSAGDEEVVRQLARKVREVLDPAGPRGNLRHDPR
jgi:PAS domain S-box-containing protein